MNFERVGHNQNQRSQRINAGVVPESLPKTGEVRVLFEQQARRFVPGSERATAQSSAATLPRRVESSVVVPLHTETEEVTARSAPHITWREGNPRKILERRAKAKDRVAQRGVGQESPRVLTSVQAPPDKAIQQLEETVARYRNITSLAEHRNREPEPTKPPPPSLIA